MIEAPPVTCHAYDVAPLTGATEYGTDVCDLQTDAAPVTTGVAGRDEIVKQRCGPTPHVFTALTQIFAEFEVNVGPKTIFTDVPVALPLMLHPAGTVQTYDVAVATAAILNVAVVLRYDVEGPVIDPG